MIPSILITVVGALLVCVCIVAIYVVARKGSVQPSEGQGSTGTATAGWPGRRHYLLFALFFAAVAVYGSLVPFGYAPLDFGQAIDRFKEILDRPFSPRSRSNFVANVLLFVPISYCLLGVLAVDRRNGVWTALCVPLVGLICTGLSVAVEFAQLWFPDRVASLNDILAQMIGTAGGVALWLMIGPAVTDWVRSCTASERPKDRIDWLLQAYLIGLLVYSVLPLDLTISPGDLVDKYRAGRITLVPFSDAGWDFATFYGLFRGIVIFIPVGMLAATWLAPPGRPVRPIATSVLLGGLVVLTIELAQLFLLSQPAATGNLIAGTLGVGLGAWMMRRWRGSGQAYLSASPSSGAARRAWLWLGLAGVYALLVAAVFCAPFEPIDDQQLIKARYEQLLRMPLASRYGGSDLRLLVNVSRKVVLFAPLGALLALAVFPLSVPRPIRRILLAVALLAACGVAASIEAAQVFLRSHWPSSTDVVFYTAGAAIGLFVTVRFLDSRRAAT